MMVKNPLRKWERSNAIRDEPETWIEVSIIDEPEAADLAADDAPSSDLVHLFGDRFVHYVIPP